MSAPSLAKYITKRPWLKRWMKPLANWYADAAGYRKLGLKADDLIPEENDTVLLALKRLPPKEAYDRVYRLRRAFQVAGFCPPITIWAHEC
ncbi:Cytochrome b-c1 complex subunit 7, mitochondrial [Lecanora helva]